jgi:dipeptidyl aminopeptidase/acylaminoacyl peptidase
MPPLVGRLRALVTTAVLLAGCRNLRPSAPRPAEGLPESIAARFLPPAPPLRVEVETLERYPTYDVRGGALVLADGVRARFEYYRPVGALRRPLILVLPILGGESSVTRLLARAFAERGIAALHAERPCEVLTPDQDGRAIEELFRRTVATTKLLLDWTVASGDADPERIGLVGISLGGILGTAVLAADTRVRRGVIALAGADLPDLLPRSAEEQVRRYLASRKEIGFDEAAVAADFAREFVSDPVHLARYVDPRGLLFIRAAFDRVVPRTNAERLWELLGRPERLDVPTGHYSAALLLPYLRGRILGHFGAWEERRSSARRPR